MRPAGTLPRLRYRWIVTDLDGTLVDRQLAMVPASRAALLRYRRAGGEVVIATGRTAASARRYYDELGLTGPAIILNGGMVENLSTGEILRDSRFDAATWAMVRDLVDRLPEAVTAAVAFQGSTARAVVRDPSAAVLVDGYTARDQITVDRATAWGADSAAQAISKLLILCADVRVAERTVALVRESGALVTVVTSEDTYVELLPAGSDKGNALAWLADRANVALDDIAAVGDNPNDVSMLQVAGLGAAVGDGHLAVRAAADIVVGPCAHGAVADVVARALAGPR